MIDRRDLAIRYAWRLLGAPYIWGGSSPQGFDCSGLLQEILSAVGLDPAGDQTANDLLQHARKNWKPAAAPVAGAVAWFGSDGRATHIALLIDPETILEAGGGGSKTTSPQAAAQQAAFVRLRPLHRRKDLIALFDPF